MVERIQAVANWLSGGHQVSGQDRPKPLFTGAHWRNTGAREPRHSCPHCFGFATGEGFRFDGFQVRASASPSRVDRRPRADRAGVTDQYAAPAVVDRLRRAGFSVTTIPMSATSKTAAYLELRARLNAGTLDLYEDTDLLAELRRLRARFSAGSAAVVNPRVGGSHGHLAQAVALAVYEIDLHGLGTRWPARRRRTPAHTGRAIADVMASPTSIARRPATPPSAGHDVLSSRPLHSVEVAALLAYSPEAWTAIGTIALAVTTAIAVAVALFQEQLRRFFGRARLSMEIRPTPPDVHQIQLTLPDGRPRREGDLRTDSRLPQGGTSRHGS